MYLREKVRRGPGPLQARRFGRKGGHRLAHGVSDAGKEERGFGCERTRRLSGCAWNLTTRQLRASFLNYFERKGHLVVPSSKLVPEGDSDLLFTTAGMVQFKDCFLGEREPTHPRLASAQRCVRAGGKHNDLESVGHTARHHTFFEMLGSFSFGDYDEREAVSLAWEYLTRELQLPAERLSVSILEGDERTADTWRSVVGLPDAKIRRLGSEDNFWSMGDTGPCGPCTEIFWDQIEPVDGERYLEIWNLVFMRYTRHREGNDCSPLLRPCIDTGMGLERLSSVVQGKRDNYETDVFSSLIAGARSVLERSLKKGSKGQNCAPFSLETVLRVIADHVRSSSHLLSEGLMPGTQGRPYVLRRIIRRAAWYAYSVGVREPVLSDVFLVYLSAVSKDHPDLSEHQPHIRHMLTREELAFFSVMERGAAEFQKQLADCRRHGRTVVPKECLFYMHDVFGFPLELSEYMAQSQGLSADREGFEELLSRARKQGRASSFPKNSGDVRRLDTSWADFSPKFTGHDRAEEPYSKILASRPGEPHEEHCVWVSIDPCPFYPEGGGVLGDRGYLTVEKWKLQVSDTIRPHTKGIALKVVLPSSLSDRQLAKSLLLQPGTVVGAFVDPTWRRRTRQNHTATHLLHSALKSVLGPHANQAGSRVSDVQIRLDVTHHNAITPSQLLQIEEWVNCVILENVRISVEHVSYQEALSQNATALFSERYDKEGLVRVVKVGNHSVELCGGIHVKETSEIGCFKIIGEHSAGTGVRRLEALTGLEAFRWLHSRSSVLDRVAEALQCKKSDTDALISTVENLVADLRAAEKDLYTLKKAWLRSVTHKNIVSNSIGPSPIEWRDSNAYARYQILYGNAVLVVHLYNFGKVACDAKLARDACDLVREQDPHNIHVIILEDRVLMCCKEPKDSSQLKKLLLEFGVKGGGSPTLVEGRCDRNTLLRLLDKYAKHP
ncbi:alanine--tRNA ligase-like [Schistocerca gregaria]|uniref:alanine--tRNA ligase-like n=1 Tax=Schistocerca gregaria TaxID=7010 RepID=UPI00211E93CF|nr:alanine--tRNA ligase-like [Schistocerca gregaria]